MLNLTGASQLRASMVYGAGLNIWASICGTSFPLLWPLCIILMAILEHTTSKKNPFEL